MAWYLLNNNNYFLLYMLTVLKVACVCQRREELSYITQSMGYQSCGIINHKAKFSGLESGDYSLVPFAETENRGGQGEENNKGVLRLNSNKNLKEYHSHFKKAEIEFWKG